MSTRKRRGGAANSRQAQKRAREAAPTPVMALETEPIELVESAGDEIVDLTCESLEPVVVDLTHNDSVVIVDERRRPRRNTRRQRQDHADSCVVSSDDEELSRDRDVYVTTHTPRNSREETSPGLSPPVSPGPSLRQGQRRLLEGKSAHRMSPGAKNPMLAFAWH
ncbi:E3 ubiquitin-protein ligase RNF4 isoform X4 [Myotis myotis]|uniref:E3 ubiquitin-protein ligase RNF4 isoform X4 n=1 Tax=Myotis myotis TaxID=51298 RepID=UPI00174BDE87|nr:E3 ubiquitin-protein ligase RNF4 isoform X4 [Myotis myotis]